MGSIGSEAKLSPEAAEEYRKECEDVLEFYHQLYGWPDLQRLVADDLPKS